MRGLFLDNLTGLVGDVFKGVANSTSRMKESVLFHNGEEEKKYKQMEERKNKEVAKLKEELKERDKQVEERNKLIKAKEEELKTREEKAKEDDAKHKEEVAKLKGEVEERNKQMARSLFLLGRHKLAIEAYKQAQVRSDTTGEGSNDWEIYHNLGICYMYLKQLDAAVEELQKSLHFQKV